MHCEHCGKELPQKGVHKCSTKMACSENLVPMSEMLRVIEKACHNEGRVALMLNEEDLSLVIASLRLNPDEVANDMANQLDQLKTSAFP